MKILDGKKKRITAKYFFLLFFHLDQARNFAVWKKDTLLHGPSMLLDEAKFVECSIIILALSFLMKHLVIGQYKNLLNSRLFIGHHLEVRLSLVSFWEPAG